MLKLCLNFNNSQPRHAYKGYAYQKKSALYLKNNTLQVPEIRLEFLLSAAWLSHKNFLATVEGTTSTNLI